MKLIKPLILCCLTFCALPGFSQALRVVPNPFIDSAAISFTLSSADTGTLVVINIAGSTVRTLFHDSSLSAASHSFKLSGDSLPSGIYIIRLSLKNTHIISKVVKISSTTEIATIRDNRPLELFPNPARDKLYFNIDLIGSSFSICDITGREITVAIRHNEIDISALPSGIYSLCLIEKKITRLFIKD